MEFEGADHDYHRELVVYEDDRYDRVIFGPKGDVLRVIRDRPFRGYR